MISKEALRDFSELELTTALTNAKDMQYEAFIQACDIEDEIAARKFGVHPGETVVVEVTKNGQKHSKKFYVHRVTKYGPVLGRIRPGNEPSKAYLYANNWMAWKAGTVDSPF
jgi:hypothetical protein